jgi:hypothetical protein
MLGDGATVDWSAAITAFEAARQRDFHFLFSAKARHQDHAATPAAFARQQGADRV